jgi:DNA (cytosine-5)-methyltransferase 1
MKHLDLFSGIGGFALAVDTVWPGSEHIFCDNDKFCQQVLKKHWPNSKIYDDIRTITDSGSKKQRGVSNGARKAIPTFGEIFILTGGFPCQPFSQAGRRKGTDDNRYLWPEMLRVIQLTQPEWIIAENVRGLLTIEGGVVFEQVCVDMESEGYEVQPFIIPAVAVNAPHRRDRVWFVANRNSGGIRRHERTGTTEGTIARGGEYVDHAQRQGLEGHPKPDKGQSGRQNEIRPDAKTGWERNWLEVATELCGVDDGLSARVDGFELTKSAHRRERLKSLGNTIVPQVAIEILKAIKNDVESNIKL